MTLESPLEAVKGVGPALAKTLAGLDLHTVNDLLHYYPRRYDDYSHVTPVKKLKPGPVTVRASFKQVRGRYVRRGMHITEAVASDATGSVRAVWFNQPYRAGTLKTNHEYFMAGQFEFSHQRLALMNPSVELVSAFPVNTARLVPVYRETKKITSSQIRRLMREVVPLMNELAETLPVWLVRKYSLMSYAAAIETMHFPPDADSLARAKRRLGFEEVFQLLLASLLNREELRQTAALSIPFKLELARAFVGHLPFTLTDGQRRVIWQIYQDMAETSPMNRMVEGDVGSGKTVVAAMAALMAMEQGFQVALMAPTELLASQHAETVYRLLEPLGFADQVGLLVGSLSPKRKTEVYKRLRAGDIRLLIGTHALIQEKVAMQKLGLVVIDEQHRFGVEQRQKLQAKAGHMPHLLSMTATPIPRSLALTLYGELDVSVLSEKPHNRKAIITKISPPSERTRLWKKVDAEIAAGRQVFVVCPLISESGQLPGSKSAEAVYEELRKGIFQHRRVGLLHGKLKAADKNAIMEQFVRHELDMLVATTVIEVGVDVPNATVMVIENAERFGLAQIHQLRGRVGRSAHQGYCYLLLSDNQPPGRRLRALEQSSDGFKLAELDLELRGPGAIYGTLQHGLLDLRLANLTDVKLIATARQAAKMFIDRGENLLQYPQLSHHVKRLQAVTNLN